MQQEKRRTNQSRSQATRLALIAAARRLFVERSYAGTGTPELVAAAGVTRGALYHHFADKQALFRAVVEAEAEAVAEEIERAAPVDLPPLEALVKGGEAFLSAMAVAGRTRLLLLDAPAVLGREDVDAIDEIHAGRTLREGLLAAMQAGVIRRLPVDILARLLAAAYDRAALSIEMEVEGKDWQHVIRALIEGLAEPSTEIQRHS
jgi:AcrR family transcriptional regulator